MIAKYSFPKNLPQIKKVILLLFFAQTLFVQNAKAQWSAVGAGANDMVYAITPDVAGTGIYCAINFGNVNPTKNWIQSSTGSSTPGNLHANAFTNDYIYAMVVVGTKIYVGGSFTTANGAGAYGGIGCWNTATNTWSTLGTGVAGSSKTVYALTVDAANNLLYVGGEFTSANGTAANNIAVYNMGTGVWSALGANGVTGLPAGSAGGSVAGVYALTMCGTKIFAGGRFTTAGGAAASNIAAWSGAAWTTLGAGVTGVTVTGPNVACAVWDAAVMALTNDGTNVYVGGDFSTAGGVAGYNNIGCWNTGTSTWSKLGNGMTIPLGSPCCPTTLGDNANVWALTMFNGNLYAGGDFEKAGTVGSAGNDLFVAEWTGGAWVGLSGACGSTLNSDVFALGSSNGTLYVGGQFSSPGSPFYLAKYTGAGPTMTMNVGSSATICQGGSVALSASGATTYSWTTSTGLSCTNCSNPTASPTTTITYTVTGTTSGCSSTKTVTINVTPTPTITITGTTNLCNSGSGTTLTASTTAGTFTWSANAGSATTNTVSVNPGVGTTVYTVTGDNSGCPGTKTATVTVSAQPTIGISAGSFSNCSGTPVVLTATTTAGTFTWSANAGGVSTSTVSVNPAAGTTTYTLSSTNGACTASTTATVTTTATPTLGISGTTSMCSGASTVLTVTTSAGTYTWSANAGSATTSTVSVSPGVGTTIYTVTGDNGGLCPVTKTVTVTVSATPTVGVSGTLTNCTGTPVILTATTSAGTYTWSANAGGVSTSTVSVNPGAGTTTYTLSASNGVCTASTTATVTTTATPTLGISGTTALCSGASTVLTATTANTYTWSANAGSATTSTISVTPGIGTTVYTVTGDNGNGCTSTKTATVTVTAQPTVGVSGTLSNCSGTPVILTATTSAGTYTWSANAGGVSTSTVSVNPVAGTTTYTLSGSNGACTASTTATVTTTATPTLTVNSPTICTGQSVVLTANTANTYSWSTTATTNTISVSPVVTTTYNVTGDNGNGCSVTKTATVTVAGTPTITISGGGPICGGTTVVLTAATASTYTWSANAGSANTATVSVTPPNGTNTYTLTGANGACTSTATVSIDVSPSPTVSVTGTNSICSGQSTTLTVSGAPTFSWSANAGGVTTNTTVVNPTTTTVYTVGGLLGSCTDFASYTVTVSPTPTLTLGSNSYTICNGNSANITSSGGTTYTWTTGTGLSCTACSSPTATPSSTTIYTVTSTTGSCVSAPATVTVNVNALPTLTLTPSTSALCSSSSSTLTASGASTYTWSPSGSLSSPNGSPVTATPTTTTDYTVIGTDANGCNNTSTVNIAVTPTPTMSISALPPTACAGQSVVLTGGTATSYTWSANAGGVNTNTVSVTPVSNTTYTLTGTNGACVSSATVTVNVNPLPIIGTASITSAPCGQSTGCINSVTVTAGTPNYQYSWDGGATWSASSTNCSIPAGTYPLQVQDFNGCIASANISVPSTSGPSAPTAAAVSSTVCSGDSAIFNISPVVGGITYTWTDVTGTHTGTSYTVTNIGPSGTYSVSVTATDINSCVSTATDLTVTVNGLPPTAITGNTHFCKGTSTTLSASPNGGGYSYQWSQAGISIVGATASSYTANAAGVYNVLITDNATGCRSSATGNYTVTIDSLPKIDTTGMVITATNCGASTGSINSVTVTGTGATYSWTDATGTVVSTSLNLGSVPAGSYCLHVTTNPDLCRDSLCALTVNSAGSPNTPVLTTPNNTYCQGQTQNPIVVTGTTTVDWYSDAGLTTQIGTGTTYTPNVVATTTLYVTATTSGCVSSVLPVVITINSTPADPLVATPTFTYCSAQTVGAITATGAPTILWSTSPTMNPIVNTGATYTPSGLPIGTTTYYLQDSSAAGCKSTGTTTVSVTINQTPADPTISSSNATYCQGQVISPITANGTGTILWYDNAGLTPVINTGATYTPPGTVGTFTYYVVDSSAAGCKSTGTATVSVTVNPTPSSPFVATPSYTYCSAQTVGAITATGAPTILWSTSPTMSPVINTGATYTPSGLPIGTTTYYLQDSSALGCKSVGTTTVTVTINQTPSDPTLSAGNGTYCQGQVISPITANGTGTILWYDNAGLTPVINTGATYTPPGTVGTFTYYVVDSSAAGCKSTGTVTVSVTVNPTPANPTLPVSTYTYCQGQPVAPITATGNPVVLWSSSSSMNPVINTGNTYTPAATIGSTTYYLQDSSAAGCKSAGIDSVTVTVYPTPTVSGGTADTAKCGLLNGGVNGVTVSGGTNPIHYQWYDSTAVLVNDTLATLSGVGSGSYSVVITDAHGCQATGSTTTFTVPFIAQPSVVITPSFTQGTAPLDVTFTSTSTNATSFNWDMGNGIFSSVQNPPMTTYTAPGTYTVTLVASNNSCSAFDTAIVVIDAPVSIIIPNIYSPNGDGINDEWYVTCVGIRDLHCDIYNRWGTLVYQLLAVDQKWDGIMNNGNAASDGTYFYILDATGFDGKQYKSHGSLTLVK